MQILKMVKKLFQRPVFCKQLTYVTLICNRRTAILQTAKIKYLIYLRVTIQLKKKFFNKISGIVQREFFGNHLTANGCQNVKFCVIIEIWKKLQKC